jgi:predicted nucleic acid-binding protein
LKVFLDSSALAKRYIQEAGSGRLETILLSASSLGVAVICVPEIISALCRLRRERKLRTSDYQKARRALLADVSDMNVVNLTDAVVARAVSLLERSPLRSSDALHVACAAEWRTELFVSADQRQCTSARAFGLKVEQLPTR